MRLLVVNNHSTHLQELLDKLDSVSVVDFQEIDMSSIKDYDALILSGGSSISVVDHEKEYQKEIELIRNFKGPILGICLGFELINFVFGEQLKLLEKKEKGIINLKLLKENRLFEGLPNEFEVYEAHRWVVPKNEELTSLAKSKDGIEAVKHPKREVYGVQFHPEAFVEGGHADKIIYNFTEMVEKK